VRSGNVVVGGGECWGNVVVEKSWLPFFGWWVRGTTQGRGRLWGRKKEKRRERKRGKRWG